MRHLIDCVCAWLYPCTSKSFSCVEWCHKHTIRYRSAMLFWGHWCNTSVNFLHLCIWVYHVSSPNAKFWLVTNRKENEMIGGMIYDVTSSKYEWKDIYDDDDELFLWYGWTTKGVSSYFQAGTIVRGPHHRESPTRCKQGLNLRRTWVQA